MDLFREDLTMLCLPSKRIEKMLEKIIVIRELYAEEKIKWFLLRSITINADADDATEYSYSIDGDGGVDRLQDSAARITALKVGRRVFAVHRHNIDFSMLFENVRREDGYDWCFKIEGTISIIDVSNLINRWKDFCGVSGLDSNTFLDRIHTIFFPVVGTLIRDENRKIREIEEHEVLPATWWERQLNGLLNGYGVRIQITHKSFFSPDAEMAEKMVEEAKARRVAEEAKRIEHEAEINAQSRADEVEELRRNREIRELEHQGKVAELKAAIKSYENQELQLQYENLMDAQSELEKFIRLQDGNVEKLERVFEEVLSKISSVSEKISQIQTPQNVERIIDPVVAPRYQGMSGDFLKLMAQVKSRAKSSVTLSYQVRDPRTDYRTRSIISGAYAKRTLGCIESVQGNGLHLRDGVTIRLTSERSGYLTLINFGTTPGAVHKIFPDGRLGAKSRYIEANRAYLMPGDLIPCPRGMEYWPVTGAATSEYGLTERVLAIVTDDDVDININDDVDININNIGTITARGGFEAVEEQITSFLDFLKLPSGSWSWGFIEAEVFR